MAATTPKSIFFHMPRTGGTWVEESLKSAFDKSYEKVVCDFGWDLPVNGIHVPPTAFLKPFEKFTYTFIRYPFDWYISYYQFLEKDKTWDEFVDGMLENYTKIVKEFEQVDYVGRTESLYFDLCKALEKAGEEFNEDDFVRQHINRSIPKDEYYESREGDILEAEDYIVKKYYS